MNRKFTDEEIHQFYVQKYRKANDERRWIYNPYVHGDKDEYERVIRNAEDRTPAHETAAVRTKINEENKEKIAAGEKVQEKPFNVTDFIDPSGVKTGLVKFPFLSGWRPLL